MSNLQRALANYDGKAVTLLSEAQVQCRNDGDYVPELIRLTVSNDALASQGASWMLAQELKAGLQLEPPALEKLIMGLPKLPDWQSALHLCQSLETQSASATQAKHIAAWAEGLLTHERPFLRAWSLHLIVMLSHRHAGLASIAHDALQTAQADKAASVRARARNLA